MSSTALVVAVALGASLLLRRKPARSAAPGDSTNDGGGSGGGAGTGGGGTGGGGGGGEPQGSAAPLSPEQRAINQLCRTPSSLTAATQRVLIDKVIEPMWDEYAANLPAQPTPDAVDRVLSSIAADVIGRCTGPRGAKQGAQLVAMDLARAVWWRKAGVSGL